MTDEEKAAFDAKEAELKELQEKLATAEKRVNDSQEMIHKQSEEVGKERKAGADAIKTVAELTAELVAANKAAAEAREAILTAREELAELKAKGPKEGDGNTQTREKPKTTDELVNSLNAAEQKKLDEAWESADEETRKAIKGNDKLYREFVSQAKDAVTEAAKSDLSSWRNTPVQDSSESNGDDDLKEKVRALFRKEKQRTQHVPPGPNSGTPHVTRKTRHTQRDERTTVNGW